MEKQITADRKKHLLLAEPLQIPTFVVVLPAGSDGGCDRRGRGREEHLREGRQGVEFHQDEQHERGGQEGVGAGERRSGGLKKIHRARF